MIRQLGPILLGQLQVLEGACDLQQAIGAWLFLVLVTSEADYFGAF